jgi:hypothetical protein
MNCIAKGVHRERLEHFSTCKDAGGGAQQLRQTTGHHVLLYIVYGLTMVMITIGIQRSTVWEIYESTGLQLVRNVKGTLTQYHS